MYNDATHHIQLLIDNNQLLLNTTLYAIKNNEIRTWEDMKRHVESFFPEAYDFVNEDKEGGYIPDILMFIPGLVFAGLRLVDYGWLIRHYREKVKERA